MNSWFASAANRIPMGLPRDLQAGGYSHASSKLAYRVLKIVSEIWLFQIGNLREIPSCESTIATTWWLIRREQNFFSPT